MLFEDGVGDPGGEELIVAMALYQDRKKQVRTLLSFITVFHIEQVIHTLNIYTYL